MSRRSCPIVAGSEQRWFDLPDQDSPCCRRMPPREKPARIPAAPGKIRQKNGLGENSSPLTSVGEVVLSLQFRARGGSICPTRIPFLSKNAHSREAARIPAAPVRSCARTDLVRIRAIYLRAKLSDPPRFRSKGGSICPTGMLFLSKNAPR